MDIYVDGSFNPKKTKYASGYAAVILDEESPKVIYGVVTEKDYTSMRNVGGEIFSVVMAIIDKSFTESFTSMMNSEFEWEKPKLTFYYDYQGIESWVTGKWKANLRATQEYADFVNSTKPFADIEFKKVPAHSGNYFNDLADQYAKKGIDEYIDSCKSLKKDATGVTNFTVNGTKFSIPHTMNVAKLDKDKFPKK